MLTAEELINSILAAEEDEEFAKDNYGPNSPERKRYSILAARERDELEERFGITNI